jgi:hypothetical protein
LDPSSWPVSSLCWHKKSTINLVVDRELEDESNIALVIKAGYQVGGVSLGAQEAQAKFSGQEAMDAFWKSTDWITRKLEREASLSLNDLSRHNYIRPKNRHNHFQIPSLAHCMCHIVLFIRVS